jgi:hypothetical protein
MVAGHNQRSKKMKKLSFLLLAVPMTTFAQVNASVADSQ